jgi:hypothetical protein
VNQPKCCGEESQSDDLVQGGERECDGAQHGEDSERDLERG